MLKQSIEEPFKWKDENLEKKLTKEIKIIDKGTESMAGLIEFKIQFNMHLETMQFYLKSLKWGDYKWLLLNRLLLLYQTFKNNMDEETIKKVTLARDAIENVETFFHF